MSFSSPSDKIVIFGDDIDIYAEIISSLVAQYDLRFKDELRLLRFMTVFADNVTKKALVLNSSYF